MTESSKIILDFFPAEQGWAYYSDSFRRGGYKNNVKIAKRIGKHVLLMHASIFVINYHNKKKFFIALSTFFDTVLYIIK